MKNIDLICDCEIIHLEIVKEVEKKMPNIQEVEKLANLYKMFADKTRLEILCGLYHNEMCVCDLAVLLNMTKSAISHQLKTLRLSNLVKNRRKGKNIYYSLADKHVYEIFEKGFQHIQA